MKATLAATAGTAVSAAGATVGAAVQMATPSDLLEIAILAAAGSGTAMLLNPPKGRRAVAASFWAGSFGGFMAAPYLANVEWFAKASEGVYLNASPVVASFVLFFGLQVAAKVLGSQKAVDWVGAFLDRFLGARK